MPTQTWATSDQLEWLKGQRVAFAKAQELKKLPAFWVDVYREFFTRWPDQASEVETNVEGSDAKTKRKKVQPTRLLVPESTADWVEGRKKKIYTWLNNHGLHKGDRRSGKVETVQVTLPQSSSRLSTELHLYSKKYYETRVKHAVDAELKELGADTKVNRIAIIHKHTAKAYKNESEELKSEIRAMREQEREEKEASVKAEKSIVDGTEEQGPENYLIAQSTLPTVIKNFCEAMSLRTGWSFSVLAGGPDPAANGTIRTIGIHVGLNTYGHSFGRAVPNFTDTYLKPYSTFLHSVYPEAIRQTYALNTEPSPATINEKSMDPNPATATTENAINAEPVPITETLAQPQISMDLQVFVTPAAQAATIPSLSFPPIGTKSHQHNMGIYQAQGTMAVHGTTTPSALFPVTAESHQHHTYQQSPLWKQGESSNSLIHPRSEEDLTHTASYDSSYMAVVSGNTMTQDSEWLTLQELMGQEFNSAAFLGMEGNCSVNNEIIDLDTAVQPPALSLNIQPATLSSNIQSDKIPGAEIQSVYEAGTIDSGGPSMHLASQSQRNRLKGDSSKSDTSKNEWSAELGARNRKPTGSREVIPLTAKENSVVLPVWLAAGLAYLSKGIEEEAWTECLDAWMEFEKGLLDVTSHRLGTKGRPKILSKWIQNRKYHAIPTIDNLEQYIDEWLNWWDGLQPGWRRATVSSMLPPPVSIASAGEDLAILKKGGPSGLITVLIGLKWWASAQDGARERWTAAVQDVKECLVCFGSATNQRKEETTTNKRKGGTGGSTKRAGKKRKN